MYNMPAGAFLTEVTEGGAADKAGIKKGDIIVKLDGQKVSGKDDLVSIVHMCIHGIETLLHTICTDMYIIGKIDHLPCLALRSAA